MSDNPFFEPGDDDRTVIRPVPGGRRAAPAPPPTAKPAPLPSVDPAAPPAVSVSPLTKAASPLLQLLDSLRAVRRAPDIQMLRQRAVHDLHAFQRSARETGIAMELLRPAHYALCASIDDVVLNAPWGAASGWSAQTLVAVFHPGAHGTDQFFEQLRRMERTPDKSLPVLELMYFCLSLGFRGRYRQDRDGTLDQMRAALHAVIVGERPPKAAELSQHWQGVPAPYRPGQRGVPVWVAFAGSAAVCGALLFWTSASLNAASDAVQAKALAATPAHMPEIVRAGLVQPVLPPPAPPEPTLLDRLRASLQSDLDSGAITLLGTPATPVIRVADHGMFAPAGAVVQPGALPVLDRIALAVRSEGGSVHVIDYTDNQPVRTVQFPSTFQLSAARADAVRAILARTIGDTGRLSAEGRADAEPIAPNTTAEGREQNRRIELVLRP